MPADDPRAVRSRRDLVRVNGWMGQAGVMARALAAYAGPDPPPRRLLDLGAGDGAFMLRIARRLAPRWPGVTAILLDRQDIVGRQTRAAFAALGWNVGMIPYPTRMTAPATPTGQGAPSRSHRQTR